MAFCAISLTISGPFAIFSTLFSSTQPLLCDICPHPVTFLPSYFAAFVPMLGPFQYYYHLQAYFSNTHNTLYPFHHHFPQFNACFIFPFHTITALKPFEYNEKSLNMFESLPHVHKTLNKF